MALIKRGSVASPALPKETVFCEALGGEVVIKGMMLSERLAHAAYVRSLAKDVDATSATACLLLSKCVLADDGKPLFTEAEWEAFGVKNHDACMELLLQVFKLSGQDPADSEKN